MVCVHLTRLLGLHCYLISRDRSLGKEECRANLPRIETVSSSKFDPATGVTRVTTVLTFDKYDMTRSLIHSDNIAKFREVCSLVYMYMYMYMHIYMYMNMYMYMHIYMYMNMSMYVYIWYTVTMSLTFDILPKYIYTHITYRYTRTGKSRGRTRPLTSCTLTRMYSGTYIFVHTDCIAGFRIFFWYTHILLLAMHELANRGFKVARRLDIRSLVYVYIYIDVYRYLYIPTHSGCIADIWDLSYIYITYHYTRTGQSRGRTLPLTWSTSWQ